VPSQPLSIEAAAEFGRRLKARRKALGLSQDDLADATQIRRQYLSNLERGWSNADEGTPANPTMAVLVALAQALHAQPRVDTAHTGEMIIVFDLDGDLHD
jgi:transcriptional regulator with XRE-family HTH domain